MKQSHCSDSWEGIRPNQICLDCYGNRIFWRTLRELKRRGYYNNAEQKRAAMDGTYRNYGWQYSAERYAIGRCPDPTKYKDEIPRHPKGKKWPEHILAKLETIEKKGTQGFPLFRRVC